MLFDPQDPRRKVLAFDWPPGVIDMVFPRRLPGCELIPKVSDGAGGNWSPPADARTAWHRVTLDAPLAEAGLLAGQLNGARDLFLNIEPWFLKDRSDATIAAFMGKLRSMAPGIRVSLTVPCEPVHWTAEGVNLNAWLTTPGIDSVTPMVYWWEALGTRHDAIWYMEYTEDSLVKAGVKHNLFPVLQTFPNEVNATGAPIGTPVPLDQLLAGISYAHQTYGGCLLYRWTMMAAPA